MPKSRRATAKSMESCWFINGYRIRMEPIEPMTPSASSSHSTTTRMTSTLMMRLTVPSIGMSEIRYKATPTTISNTISEIRLMRVLLSLGNVDFANAIAPGLGVLVPAVDDQAPIAAAQCDHAFGIADLVDASGD